MGMARGRSSPFPSPIRCCSPRRSSARCRRRPTTTPVQRGGAGDPRPDVPGRRGTPHVFARYNMTALLAGALGGLAAAGLALLPRRAGGRGVRDLRRHRRGDRRPLPPAFPGASSRAAPYRCARRRTRSGSADGTRRRARAPPGSVVRGRRLRRRVGRAGRPGPLAPAAVRAPPLPSWACCSSPRTCCRRSARHWSAAIAGRRGLCRPCSCRTSSPTCFSWPCRLPELRCRPRSCCQCADSLSKIDVPAAAGVHGCWSSRPEQRTAAASSTTGRAQRRGVGEPPDVEPAAQRRRSSRAGGPLLLRWRLAIDATT